MNDWWKEILIGTMKGEWVSINYLKCTRPIIVPKYELINPCCYECVAMIYYEIWYKIRTMNEWRISLLIQLWDCTREEAITYFWNFTGRRVEVNEITDWKDRKYSVKSYNYPASQRDFNFFIRDIKIFLRCIDTGIYDVVTHCKRTKLWMDVVGTK